MKLEKEVNIYEIQHWTNMPKKFGVDLSMTIKDLLNEKEMNILNTIIKKNKIKLTLEYQEPILDEKERKYLSDVIRPFRDKVEYIEKIDFANESEYLRIEMKNEPDWSMPLFKKGTMYKGIELNKEYTIQELGL